MAYDFTNKPIIPLLGVYTGFMDTNASDPADFPGRIFYLSIPGDRGDLKTTGAANDLVDFTVPYESRAFRKGDLFLVQNARSTGVFWTSMYLDYTNVSGVENYQFQDITL